jgi:hypothetical protein
MRQAGLTESDVMELCGWETREMFKRYRIKTRKALAKAAAKLNGTITAQSEAAEPSALELTSDVTT